MGWMAPGWDLEHELGRARVGFRVLVKPFNPKTRLDLGHGRVWCVAPGRTTPPHPHPHPSPHTQARRTHAYAHTSSPHHACPRYLYDIDHRRLGFDSFKALVELNGDLVLIQPAVQPAPGTGAHNQVIEGPPTVTCRAQRLARLAMAASFASSPPSLPGVIEGPPAVTRHPP